MGGTPQGIHQQLVWVVWYPAKNLDDEFHAGCKTTCGVALLKESLVVEKMDVPWLKYM